MRGGSIRLASEASRILVPSRSVVTLVAEAGGIQRTRFVKLASGTDAWNLFWSTEAVIGTGGETPIARTRLSVGTDARIRNSIRANRCAVRQVTEVRSVPHLDYLPGRIQCQHMPR